MVRIVAEIKHRTLIGVSKAEVMELRPSDASVWGGGDGADNSQAAARRGTWNRTWIKLPTVIGDEGVPLPEHFFISLGAGYKCVDMPHNIGEGTPFVLDGTSNSKNIGR